MVAATLFFQSCERMQEHQKEGCRGKGIFLAICNAGTADHLLLREALEQALACEELHHDHGKAVDICRPRHLPLLQQLWGHVGSRACATQHPKSQSSPFSCKSSNKWADVER